MLDSLLQQTTIPILEQATAYGQKRHQILAGNIANIDTPDYKTRDLPQQDFEKALEEAFAARRRNAQPHITPASSPGMQPMMWPQEGHQSSSPGMMHPAASPQPSIPAPKLQDYFTADLTEADEVTPRNLTFHDGGNRSIEMESMEMVKNKSMQSFAIEVMITQMSMLEAVISERVV